MGDVLTILFNALCVVGPHISILMSPDRMTLQGILKNSSLQGSLMLERQYLAKIISLLVFP